MNERALENWLDNASERAFQEPFAHSLSADGYQVVHVSRHCAMEMGKDILAIAPDGVPCAYQLKDIEGKQLTLGKWRADLERQVVSLVYNKIVHPSITSSKKHRAFIVINGELSEEVSHSIDQFNRNLDKGRPKLKTIVKGELIDRFKKLGSDFWPADISVEFKVLLELLLTDGAHPFPKNKFAELLEATLRLDGGVQKASSKKHAARLNGAAILCSYAIAPFQRRDNHVAEFEAWTMLFSYVLGFCEINKISEKFWQPIVSLIRKSIFNALGRLCDELMGRKRLSEGDPLVDRYVRRVRITYLIALMGLLGLWYRKMDVDANVQLNFINKFIKDYSDQLLLWGEAAGSQFLSTYLFTRVSDASMASERILYGIVSAISSSNQPRKDKGLTSPYYEPDQVLADNYGSDEERIREKFAGSAYCLEAFFHLLVSSNLKQTAKLLWPNISRISFTNFRPEPAWRFYQWRAKKGLTTQKQMKATQQWDELLVEASERGGKSLPRLIRRFPVEYLALLIVFPHRFTSDGVRWLSHGLDL